MMSQNSWKTVFKEGLEKKCKIRPETTCEMLPEACSLGMEVQIGVT